ncbi:hypothetical protein K402DRAFT_70331 [Aulographum hederae CBS 113979]|uniref:Uncharacterized protein n=1 Tax=Aulographum hederae CBS 113979 TaxID=1176131 RepID=A0A6G1HF68_9PEZI|nr:hypothetical protein K402DRAFT_70331 [Aulographum hederae CBS 113979]
MHSRLGVDGALITPICSKKKKSEIEIGRVIISYTWRYRSDSIYVFHEYNFVTQALASSEHWSVNRIAPPPPHLFAKVAREFISVTEKEDNAEFHGVLRAACGSQGREPWYNRDAICKVRQSSPELSFLSSSVDVLLIEHTERCSKRSELRVGELRR